MFQLLLKSKIFICIIISFTLNGHKCNAIKCQKDPIATAKDLLDSAQKAFSASDRQLSDELLQKYIHGVLCCAIFQIKFKNNNFISEKNFFNVQKIQKDFCLELSKGKSIEKAGEKIENMAIKLVKELAEDKKIKKNIQKSLEANQNSFKLDETNINVLKTELFKKFSNENLNKLTSLLYLELNQFLTFMKALKVENVGINGGALTSVDGRRRKRANFLENVFGKIKRFQENDEWRRTRCTISVILALLMIGAIISSILVLIINTNNSLAWLLLVFNFAFFLYHAIAIKKDCPGFFNTNTSNTIQLGSVQP